MSILHHFQDITRISPNIKMSRDCDHTHLRDYLSIHRLLLHTANQCTKHEVSSLRHFRYI